MDYCLITFVSTHAAISAQKLLEPVCPVRVMPVLRELSSGCGIALRLAPVDLGAARAALAASSLPPVQYGFYGVSGSGTALQTETLP